MAMVVEEAAMVVVVVVAVVVAAAARHLELGLESQRRLERRTAELGERFDRIGAELADDLLRAVEGGAAAVLHHLALRRDRRRVACGVRCAG